MESPSREPLAYSVAAAARCVGVSRPTFYRLIRAGRVRTVTLFRRRVVPADALAELLAPPTMAKRQPPEARRGT